MSRRAPRLCTSCARRAQRRVRGARLCSPCAARAGKRTCEACGEAKFADLFATKTRCRACQRDQLHDKRVVETYGLAPGQYRELLEFQGGVSAIAGLKPGTKRLAVDHDHRTGEVRGLLTKHENFYLIGWLERFDDPLAVLAAAAEYLRHPPAKKLWGEDVPRQSPAG